MLLHCLRFSSLVRNFRTSRVGNFVLNRSLIRLPPPKLLGAKPAKWIYLSALGSLCTVSLASLHLPFSVVSCDQNEVSQAVPDSDVPDKCVWTVGDLIDILWPEFFTIAISVLAAVMAAVMNVLIPIYLGNLAETINDCFGNRREISEIYRPAGKLLSAYAIQALSTFSYIGLLGAAGERIARNLRMELFEKLVYRNIPYFDSHNASKLMESITSDVQSFKSSFKQCVSQGLRGITQVTGSVYALFAISSPLTFTLLVSLPCVFLVGTLLGSELRRLSRKAQTQGLLAASIAEESFTHIRSVKALALENSQIDRYNSGLKKASRLGEQLGYGIGMFQGLSNMALNGVVLAVLLVGGHLLSKDQLRPGQLLSFLATTQTMQRSLSQLSLLYGQVLRGSTALNRIFKILKEENSTDFIPSSPAGWADLSHLADEWHQPNCAPTIQFDSVTFSYPTRPDMTVLESLTLSVPSGKVVALVGKSGAGKSTVVSLLERFYDASAGNISLAGHDIREFPVSGLRGQLIGYISQEPQIFNASIRENIRFGKPDATDEQVEEAARLANAHEFIVSQLPNGYDTLVGQGSDGVAGLSGGQRQRIAIARVLLKNAPVLVLDEATSALDAESEAQVQEALKTVMKGRTVLVIAHRLSTIRKADLIVVMSSGRIVEQGTHEQLIAKRGQYYDLVRTQGADGLVP